MSYIKCRWVWSSLVIGSHSLNSIPPLFFKKEGTDFLKIRQKGGDSIFFLIRGGLKKGVGWCNKRGYKENLQNFFNFFKGNPNFQGILNWILQILHYYCRKQRKNIENVVMSLCPSLFTATCAPFAFLCGRVFSVLEHSTLQDYIEF